MIWKYTINPWIKNLTENETKFKKELETIDSIWFYYPHIFKRKVISTYWAVIISTSGIERLEVIKTLYGIEPSKVFSDGKIFHFVFDVMKWIDKSEYNRTWRSLAFLYDGEVIDYHFYPKHKITEKYSSELNGKELRNKCFQLFRILTIDENYEKELSLHNFKEYEKTKKISLLEIAEELKESIVDIDEMNNIHIKYGYPYQYVLNFFWLPSKAFEFFNEKYELDFKIEFDNDWDIINDWVPIKEGGWLMVDKNGYFTLTENKTGIWERKDVSDFFIRVYYKIVWNDWLTQYIVSFTSASNEIETQKILWLNSTSVTAFSDFVQQYWNYHFLWTSQHIKELHKHVTETRRIPIIKSVVWYGHHNEDGVVIFENGIFDLKEKLFTPKKEWENYYFNYNWDWYIIVDNVWNPLGSISWWIPSLTEKHVDMDEVYEFVEELYKDDSWIFLLLSAFWMFWYMLYWNPEKAFPLMFTRGITGSGKTSYNDLMKRIWGMSGAGVEFSGSSNFSLTHAFSLLKQFPYFISEYREKSINWVSKVSMLRSVFDKSGQTKWKADQTTVTYQYNVMPVIEWEEMINDWAVRTRSIQKQFLHKHRISWNFDAIVEKWKHLLDWVLYTYAIKSKWKKYEKYIEEWFKIFKVFSKESRIARNSAIIYAGCMCFNVKQKDIYVDILTGITKFQENDFKNNGTWQQIMRAISSYLSSMKNFPMINPVTVLPDHWGLVIDWALFEVYASKNKLELTLKLDSYKEHLEAMWFPVEMYDTGEDMVYWIRVALDKIPKEFLVDWLFYLTNREYKRLKTLPLKEQEWLIINP